MCAACGAIFFVVAGAQRRRLTDWGLDHLRSDASGVQTIWGSDPLGIRSTWELDNLDFHMHLGDWTHWGLDPQGICTYTICAQVCL